MNLSPEQAAQKAKGSQLLVHLLAPLARGDEKVTTKELAKVAADMVSEGYMSASDAVQMLGKLPTDPAGIKMTVQKLFKGSLLAAINLHGAQALADDTAAAPAPQMPPGAPPAAGA